MPGAGIELTFNTNLYSPSAVKNAAYRFGDRCYVTLDQDNEGVCRVVLRPKRTLENADAIAGEFCNEVLDQDLRERIAAETQGIRNVLMAQAFSRLNLVEPAVDQGHHDTDSLGIAKRTAAFPDAFVEGP